MASGAASGKRKRSPLDVSVPAGSVVLFDANLLHAAWSNEAPSGTSERVAFHYIPSDAQSEFRGVSFARGAFADRHVARSAETKRELA